MVPNHQPIIEYRNIYGLPLTQRNPIHCPLITAPHRLWTTRQRPQVLWELWKVEHAPANHLGFNWILKQKHMVLTMKNG